MRAISALVSIICISGLAIWAHAAVKGWLQERRATRAFKPVEDELERMWNTKEPR
jgi:hypothetical protein